MHKSKFVLLAALCCVATLFLFGCTDPLEAAKSSPTIQAFMAEYPNAELNVQLMTEDLVIVDTGFVSHCTAVAPAQYYKVVLTDAKSGMNAFAFVTEGGSVVCAYKGENATTPINYEPENDLVSDFNLSVEAIPAPPA